MGIVNSLSFILKHPLNRGRPLRTLRRYVSWQLGSRLAPGPIAVPYVNAARLLVSPSMAGATGNIYCGLHEFEDMAFLLHALRPADLFVDVGANVGSYTVLASAALGAASVAIEPVPATFSRLVANVRLNGIDALVSALNVGCGASRGQLEFTSGLDSVNHVASAGDVDAPRISVPVDTLDSLLTGRRPAMIKIDVEGYETEVLAGGQAVFADPELLAVIMELNGSGSRYGFDEPKLHADMLSKGFVTAAYAPETRTLTPTGGAISRKGNTLYVRDLVRVQDRVRSAPAFSVLDRLI